MARLVYSRIADACYVLPVNFGFNELTAVGHSADRPIQNYHLRRMKTSKVAADGGAVPIIGTWNQWLYRIFTGRAVRFLIFFESLSGAPSSAALLRGQYASSQAWTVRAVLLFHTHARGVLTCSKKAFLAIQSKHSASGYSTGKLRCSSSLIFVFVPIVGKLALRHRTYILYP